MKELKLVNYDEAKKANKRSFWNGCICGAGVLFILELASFITFH